VGDEEMAAPVPEASSSSGGGHKDATVPQEASQGPDMNMDAGDEPVDDVAAPAKDSGPEGGQCGMCMFPMRCCMTPGAMYYGQCYNQFLCATCCL